MTWLIKQQRDRLAYWLPALASGGVAWLTFITLGHTPLIRATGLTLVIIGVALTLRRLGVVFAVAGGLALAYAPAFWSQTGGGESAAPATIVVALAAASGIALLVAWLGKRPMLGIGLALVVFALIFWSQIGTPRSLRLTSFTTAWLVYFLINILRVTNPRPDDPPRSPLDGRYPLAVLLLLSIGVVNDPLFVLFAPAVILTFVLARAPLPRWYWAVIGIAVVLGARGVLAQYVHSFWWLFPADQAETLGIRVPYLLADGWREASRWIGLINLVISQFTLAGVLLGVIGLSRLSRWYPPMGIVTMVAYAAYALFGLVYFGQDRPALLLPLLIIQIIWMTYAVYAFGQWLQKSAHTREGLVSWLAPAAFTLMPLLLFLQIARAA